MPFFLSAALLFSNGAFGPVGTNSRTRHVTVLAAPRGLARRGSSSPSKPRSATEAAPGRDQNASSRADPPAADGPPAPIAPAVIARDGTGHATIRAVRIETPLRIDGKLDEDVYRTVLPFGDFIQMLPKPGEPATEKTEAWVLFDRTTLYISARCWDSAPESEWVANELRRDTSQLRQNDQFGLLLDTFHDRRNGFQFYTNPLGAIADGTITDEANPSSDWNAVWEVKTGRFEGGWTVEMAIPFRALRYRDDPSPVWGIQFRRAIRRKNEWVYLTAVPPSGGGASNGPAGIFRISAAGTLVGLDVPPASKNIELKPYGISRSTVDRSLDRAAPNNLDGDVGLDAKFGVSSSLTADFTYNTDFAQVEVDEQQINLTRFSLLFPEKRDFFLEGRGLFDFAKTGSVLTTGAASNENTPIMFFSRRIGLNGSRVVPIDVGGRLTGKVGKVGLGVLNIRTGEDATSGTRPSDFTVVRVKRDILRRSSVGGLFTNRSVSTVGKGANSLYGADAAFSFYQDVNLSGYLARTETPGLKGDDLSYQARFEYAGDRYGAQLEHLAVGDHFNPEVGFLRRDDFRRTLGLLRFSPRPRSIRQVRRFIFSGSLEYIVNGAGSLESRHQQAHFNTEFQNSDQVDVALNVNYELLAQPFAVVPRAAIPAGGYSFTDVIASYQLGAQRRASGTVSLQHGSFYNGTITALGYNTARVEVTRRLSFEPGVSLNWLDLPTGRFGRHLARGRVDYAFSPRMFAGALLQYNASERTYSDNLRLRWEYQPGSELFVVYTDERSTVGRGFPFLQNRAFVVKINRLFQF